MAPNPLLGIVAGGGDIPGQLVEQCHAKGRDVFVLALHGHADADRFPTPPDAWIRIGQAGKGIKILHDAGVQDLIVIGRVRRPKLFEMRLDFRAFKFLIKIGRRIIGDNSLISAIAHELERDGFRIIPPEDLLNEMLAVERHYGGPKPGQTAMVDIKLGIEAARNIGRLDIGQAAVVHQGRVLGVEDEHGTDALIRRCATVNAGRTGAVLVKVCKPGQERRIDLPTIGVGTVEAAAASGFLGVAVEAGGALIVDAGAVSLAADRLGVFVLGITVPADIEVRSAG